MSEQDALNLSDDIAQGIVEAQRRMLERKAKLGESVVIADAEGHPVTVSAQEVLRSYGRQ